MPAAAAPPAGTGQQTVQIIDTPPPTPPPAPTTSIKVSAMPGSAEAAKPPAKGSAMDRLRQELAKKAKPQGGEINAPPEAPAAPPAAKTAPKPGEESPNASPDHPEGDPGSTTTEPGSSETKAKAGKANPWKLVDQYKGRVGELEKQIADAKTGALAETQRNEYLKQIEDLKKQNDSLNDEMRFVNYAKSKDFLDKYQAPYEAAWKRAVSELSEISLTDPQSGNARPATADDLLALVNLPLGRAREVAEQIFGNFADDVMAHRKEIRSLFDAQREALETAKTTGAEREKQQRELMEKNQGEMLKTIKETWDKHSAEVMADERYGKFFNPVEGDQEGNQRLAKGFELADKAFASDPRDPRLSPEERVAAVKRHVALRNRAAAFGRLVHQIGKLEAEKAAIMKELEAFKNSTPTAGGGDGTQQTTAPTTARESIFAALRAKAK